jgi:hypothetical protein
MHDDPLPFRDPPFMPRAVSWRRLPLVLLVLLIGLVATGQAIRHIVDHLAPPPEIGDLGVKIDWYLAHRAEIDVVFIGTSHVAYAVETKVFDAETRALGCPTSSFSLAVAGLNYRELIYLLNFVADHPPPKLRLVLFEPRPNASRDLKTLLTPRFRSTLTLGTFWRSIDDLLVNQRDADRTSFYVGAYLAAFAYQNLGIGALAERVLHPTRRARPSGPQWQDGQRGFEPLGMDGEAYEPHAKDFRGAKLEEWRREVDDYANHLKKMRLEPDWKRILRSELAVTARIPGRAIAFSPPTTAADWPLLMRKVRDLQPGMTTIHSDVLSDPALFDPDLWWDEGHLNREGALAYSQVLARRVCPILLGQSPADSVADAQPPAR